MFKEDAGEVRWSRRGGVGGCRIGLYKMFFYNKAFLHGSMIV